MYYYDLTTVASSAEEPHARPGSRPMGRNKTRWGLEAAPLAQPDRIGDFVRPGIGGTLETLMDYIHSILNTLSSVRLAAARAFSPG
jgi:hypothetical protein